MIVVPVVWFFLGLSPFSLSELNLDTDQFLFQKYWHSNLQRLQELLEIKPTCQAYPLVIVVGASANQNVSYDCLSECLNLDHFIDQGFICDVKIVVLDINEQLRKGINVVDPRISEKVRNDLFFILQIETCLTELICSKLMMSLAKVSLKL